MNALENSLKALLLIVNKKRFTTKDLAQELDCSERQARRYMKVLKDAFRDSIIQEKKGIYKWKTISEIDDKLKDSSLIRLMRALIELGENIHKDKTYWKDLKKIFKTKDLSRHELNKIIFDRVISYEKIRYNKDLIETAISKGYVLKFKYKDKFYYIEPYQVLFYSGIWYVAGIDRGEDKVKTFSIDLMENVEYLRDEIFLKKNSVYNEIKDLTSVWQVGDKENFESITVEVKKEVANYFQRKEYLFKQQIISTQPNGNIIISFSVKNENDFKIQIFHWLPYFKIIEPEKYKKLYLKILNNAIEFQNN